MGEETKRVLEELEGRRVVVGGEAGGRDDL